jgi:hypothetical protein
MRLDHLSESEYGAHKVDQLNEAVFYTVHEFRKGKERGATALAPLVNMRPGTLSNKANPDQDHQLTLNESILVMRATGDYRILYALCAILDHTLPIRILNFEDTSDLELLDAYARYHAEVGETAQAIRDAFADGDITPEELKRIEKEMDQAQQAEHELRLRLRALARERQARKP